MIDPFIFRFAIFVLAIFVGYYGGLVGHARLCTHR